MIRIAIAEPAFEAIKATPPVGSVKHRNSTLTAKTVPSRATGRRDYSGGTTPFLKMKSP
jgi:hypothetical protein